MYQLRRLFWGGILICLQSGVAANPKELTTYIQTDLPSEMSAEANDLTQPFFAAPSTGNEVMEKVEELEARLEKLEERVGLLEKTKVGTS